MQFMKEILTSNLSKWYSLNIQSFKTIFLTMTVLFVNLIGWLVDCLLGWFLA